MASYNVYHIICGGIKWYYQFFKGNYKTKGINAQVECKKPTFQVLKTELVLSSLFSQSLRKVHNTLQVYIEDRQSYPSLVIFCCIRGNCLLTDIKPGLSIFNSRLKIYKLLWIYQNYIVWLACLSPVTGNFWFYHIFLA